MERKRVAEAAKGVGRPKIGGTFQLVDQEGETFGDGDLKGGFSIVSSSSVRPGAVVLLQEDLERAMAWYLERVKGSRYSQMLIEACRSTSASRTAPTSAPKNSTSSPK